MDVFNLGNLCSPINLLDFLNYADSDNKEEVDFCPVLEKIVNEIEPEE